MNVGVALWDPEDRLIGCNAAYRDLYSEIAAELLPGCSYRELMTVYHAAAPPEVIGGRTLTEFIADGERRRRSGSEVSEVVRHHRGRWLLMTDCRTANGGIICFRSDITEQKVIEHELTKRRKLIDDLADLTYDWFWRQDAEGRFVEFSAAMELHVKLAPDGLLGRRREDMPGFEADPNQYAEYRTRARAARAVSMVHLPCAARRRQLDVGRGDRQADLRREGHLPGVLRCRARRHRARRHADRPAPQRRAISCADNAGHRVVLGNRYRPARHVGSRRAGASRNVWPNGR